MCGGDDIYKTDFRLKVVEEITRRSEMEISKTKKINFDKKEGLNEKD